MAMRSLRARDVHVALEPAAVEDRRREGWAVAPRQAVAADEGVQRARREPERAGERDVRKERGARRADVRLGGAQPLLGREHVRAREQQLGGQARGRAAPVGLLRRAAAAGGAGPAPGRRRARASRLFDLRLRAAAARPATPPPAPAATPPGRRSSAEVRPARGAPARCAAPRAGSAPSCRRAGSAPPSRADARYAAATSWMSESRKARCACTVAR